MTAPDEQHEWLSLTDAAGATWLFDLDFLLSNYHCIYGQGCPSIEPEPDPTGVLGCCTHGAHFTDRDDRRRVLAHADRLEAGEWQFRGRAGKRGGPLKKKGDDWVTRRAGGACIFLNRAGFAGGSGCALHAGALRRGERPIDWKPTVCWQVPIRLDVHTDDYGHETVLVRAWRRRDWGPGGAEFHWWCTEETSAHTASAPVYRTARDELVELCGADLYRRLAARLDRRRALVGTPVELG